MRKKMTAMWPFNRPKKDLRSGRLVFLIECLLNQNARDLGAAENPAVTREVMDLLADNGIGMVQIPCPEIACLGFERRRPAGQSIRQALGAPGPANCCRKLAAATADRIKSDLDQGFEVLAILGGNEESPGCAVHITGAGETELAARSGVFMLALAAELERRDLQIQFRRMRDANAKLLNEDINWLRDRLS
ncbi:hypothetical protein [Sedimenticola selenatireducens]|uniref:hypothetical protein n=1 Tax=Sedimenticola selenatireducens TaxID=191960 RepID=UPI0004B995F2|nr:hypothetical protein [Sedimenticola selenatireducens]